MSQFSQQVDEALNKLSRNIGKSTKKIEKETQKRDASWEEVVSYFNEVAQDQPSPRFIANDGYTLQYQLREGSPSLDVDKLQALIYQTYPRSEATKIWNSITKRTIDTAALEAAVRVGKVSENIVSECMTPAKKTYARVRREWTKDDRNTARILGIQLVEVAESEEEDEG